MHIHLRDLSELGFGHSLLQKFQLLSDHLIFFRRKKKTSDRRFTNLTAGKR